MNSARRAAFAGISVIIVALFFNVEFYKQWLDQRVVGPLKNISNDLAYMETNERLTMRLGSSYVGSVSIADWVRKNGKEKDPLVLMPPNDYVKEHKLDFPVPEPAIFYYYTGMKSIGANNKGVEKANYAVVFTNGNNLQIIPLDAATRAEVITLFKKYKN